MKKNKQKNTDITDPEFIRKRSLIFDFAALRILNISTILKSISIAPPLFFSNRTRDIGGLKMVHLDNFVNAVNNYRNFLRELLEEDESEKNALYFLLTIDRDKICYKQIWGRQDNKMAYVKVKLRKGERLRDTDIALIFDKISGLYKCISYFLRSIEDRTITHFSYEIPKTIKQKMLYIPQKKGSKEIIKNNINEILKRKANGESIEDIAISYNVSSHTLYVTLKEYHDGRLFYNKNIAKKTVLDNIESIISRIDTSNEKISSIAKEYNVTPNYLGIIINNYRISRSQTFSVDSSQTINSQMDRLGSKVLLLREKAGLSQQELANVVETNSRYISEIERGILNPRLDLLIKIVKALGKNIDIVD